MLSSFMNDMGHDIEHNQVESNMMDETALVCFCCPSFFVLTHPLPDLVKRIVPRMMCAMIMFPCSFMLILSTDDKKYTFEGSIL